MRQLEYYYNIYERRDFRLIKCPVDIGTTVQRSAVFTGGGRDMGDRSFPWSFFY